MPVARHGNICIPTNVLAATGGEKTQEATKNGGAAGTPVVDQRELVSIIDSDTKHQGGGNSAVGRDVEATAL